MVFPAQLMEMEGGAPEVGSVAKDAGKSIQCTARKPYSYVCILSGGTNPIPNGLVVIYHFMIRATAPAGATTIRIEKAEATTVDSTKWTLNNTETIVNIQ